MAILQTDPLDIALDPTAPGKIIFVNGDILLANGLGGVAQLCRIAVSMVRGEWFLNLGTGIPYFQRVGVPATQALLGQPYVQSKTLDPFRTALALVPGVVQVQVTASYNRPTRAVNLGWTVQAVFGGTLTDSLSYGI